jgi:hypothetical protein
MEPKTPSLRGRASNNENRAVTAEPSETYREARELIQALIKTIKSYRIYALNSPVLKRFVDQLHQKLGSYLKEEGVFRFGIEEFSFTFDGQVIHRNEDMAESLPFLMYRNGLRELWFEDGLSYRELTGFLKTFRSYEILKDSYEDLVTLLWDAEFPSIHFWATDDFLWDPIEIPKDMKAIVEKMEMPMGQQRDLESDMRLPRWFFKSEELDEIKAAIPREIAQVDYVNLLMVLAEVISQSGTESKTFERVVDFFKGVLDTFVLSQDFKNLIKILSFTRILIRDRRLDSSEMAFIQTITEYLGEPQSIERLTTSTARSRNLDHETFQKYLVLLSKNAIAPLCGAWLKMESAEGRTAISNALVELGKNDIPNLGRFLRDDQVPLVLNVVNILARIGTDPCIHYIGQVKGHQNPKVRHEALHALATFNHPQAKAPLTTFLDDPEMQIRIDASKVLVKKLGPEALPHLARRILSKVFDTRPLKERNAYLQHLGKIEVPDGVRILEQILFRRVFSRRAQWKKTKSLIQSVLASMDIEDAKVALARWKKKRERWFFRLLY